MAFIKYLSLAEIPDAARIGDDDNILRIHSVHDRLIKLHFELYRELIFSKGSLTRIQREMIAVVVSAVNECHY